MKKQKIYIAGPMRGLPDFNYPAFNDCAEAHRAVGWDVVNPVEIGAGYGTPEQINADPALLAAVMAAELHALETCDAIYLLDGWQNSEGARKELATAIAYGLKIYLASVAAFQRDAKAICGMAPQTAPRSETQSLSTGGCPRTAARKFTFAAGAANPRRNPKNNRYCLDTLQMRDGCGAGS